MKIMIKLFVSFLLTFTLNQTVSAEILEVNFEHVKEIFNGEFCDVFSGCDYYPVVTIDGVGYGGTNYTVKDKQDYYAPTTWKFERDIASTRTNVPVTISFWENDSTVGEWIPEADKPITINGENLSLNLNYNMANGTFSGDKSGSSGEKFTTKGSTSLGKRSVELELKIGSPDSGQAIWILLSRVNSIGHTATIYRHDNTYRYFSRQCEEGDGPLFPGGDKWRELYNDSFDDLIDAANSDFTAGPDYEYIRITATAAQLAAYHDSIETNKTKWFTCHIGIAIDYSCVDILYDALDDSKIWVPNYFFKRIPSDVFDALKTAHGGHMLGPVTTNQEFYTYNVTGSDIWDGVTQNTYSKEDIGTATDAIAYAWSTSSAHDLNGFASSHNVHNSKQYRVDEGAGYPMGQIETESNKIYSIKTLYQDRTWFLFFWGVWSFPLDENKFRSERLVTEHFHPEETIEPAPAPIPEHPDPPVPTTSNPATTTERPNGYSTCWKYYGSTSDIGEIGYNGWGYDWDCHIQQGGLPEHAYFDPVLGIDVPINLDPATTLHVEISGSAGQDTQIIVITNPITLGGTLEVTVANDYEPKIGDRIRIFSAQSINGKFEQIILPDSSGGFEYITVYDDTGIDFLVVTKPQLQSLGDINTNGRQDIAALVHDAVANTVIATVKDAENNSLISTVVFDGSLTPLRFIQLPDINSNGAPELVVLGTGLVKAEVRDSLTGSLLSTVNFNPNITPVDIGVIPDRDGNGIPELAVLGKHPTKGFVNVQTRDALTGNKIASTGFVPSFIPKQLLVLPDIDNNGMPEFAVLAVEDSAEQFIKVEIRNFNGAPVRDIWLDQVSPDPLYMAMLDDMNGNGAVELVTLRQKKDWVNVVVSDALSGVKLSSIGYNPNFVPLKLVVMPDLNGNGVSELAVFGKNPTTDEIKAEVRDASSGALIKDVFFWKVFTPQDLVTIPDISGNGKAELGMLGLRLSDGALRAYIKDVMTNTDIINVRF